MIDANIPPERPPLPPTDPELRPIYDQLMDPAFRTDAQNYRVRRIDFERDINNGIMPELDNGYSFVIHHPGPDEGIYIPTSQFAGYFEKRQVPIVAKGNFLHTHDTNHGPNYQTLLKDKMFADVTQQAAANAVKSNHLSDIFADTIDKFSDNMLLLEQNARQQNNPSGLHKLSNVNEAEVYLQRLIELAGPDMPPDDVMAIATPLKESLGINAYRLREQKYYDEDRQLGRLSLGDTLDLY